VSDKFDDSAVAVWVPIAKWDGFGANRPSRTNRRRPDQTTRRLSFTLPVFLLRRDYIATWVWVRVIPRHGTSTHTLTAAI
jgi:hypothetical protein